MIKKAMTAFLQIKLQVPGKFRLMDKRATTEFCPKKLQTKMISRLMIKNAMTRYRQKTKPDDVEIPCA